ncbi:SH3 domain-containing protein [Pseudomonas sp. CGJS7]|uniref:SH3 domain-containing protein n=1 Tax=Pseudomonas sp. CGJS7 TaxID=3109348 RepID=UPI00300A96FD
MLVDHRAPDRPAIRIARGDTLSLGERDHEWPQFVWAVQADGLGGWAPASLFDRDRGAATAQSDYDTVELDAAAGAVVRLHHELAQWWWASDAHGRQGWIPARALQLLEDADTFTAGSIA